MQNTTYTGLSLQMALRRQMDVIANNVANMSTDGFKAERVMFLQYVVDAHKAGVPKHNATTMVSDYGSYRDTREGAFTITGNPLDIALSGNGFLVVSTGKGDRYTRGGTFQLNADRDIVDRYGNALQDENGGKINVPQETTQITIADDGSISTETGQIAKLKVVAFQKEQYLTPTTGGLYSSSEFPNPDALTRIQQGVVEQSNVQPISEMTQMIDLERTYQTVQNLLAEEHDRERNAISKLSKSA